MKRTKTFLLRISQELFEALSKRAEKNNRSINAEILTILEDKLNSVVIPIEGTIKDGVITIEEELARR